MSHNYLFEYYQKKVQLKTEVQCEVKCLLRLHHLGVFESVSRYEQRSLLHI